jgi:hypothetical protein
MGFRQLTLRVVAAATFGVLLFGMTAISAQAKPAPPGPGNSPSAKACSNGGWRNLVTSTGASFASQDACVAYAARGGVLVTKAAACLNGGWQNVVTSTGATFASEDECVAYAARGGVLTPKPTAALTYTMSGCELFGSDLVLCDSYIIAGTGLKSDGYLYRCRVGSGCLDRPIDVGDDLGSDGTLFYQATFGESGYVCTVGAYYTATTAAGGTIQSEPLTCTV